MVSRAEGNHSILYMKGKFQPPSPREIELDAISGYARPLPPPLFLLLKPAAYYLNCRSSLKFLCDHSRVRVARALSFDDTGQWQSPESKQHK